MVAELEGSLARAAREARAHSALVMTTSMDDPGSEWSTSSGVSGSDSCSSSPIASRGSYLGLPRAQGLFPGCSGDHSSSPSRMRRGHSDGEPGGTGTRRSIIGLLSAIRFFQPKRRAYASMLFAGAGILPVLTGPTPPVALRAHTCH